MTERQLTQRFLKQLKAEYSWYYWYKIGDTFGGHKKPCDMIACVQGQFIAIEFKKDGGDLTDFQLESIPEIVGADGLYIVGDFLNNGKELHFEDIVLHYKKGRYENIEFWIESLEKTLP